MSEDELRNLPTLEQAKAALRKAERAYGKAFGLQAHEAAGAALKEARDTYTLVAAVSEKRKSKKERHRSTGTVEE